VGAHEPPFDRHEKPNAHIRIGMITAGGVAFVQKKKAQAKPHLSLRVGEVQRSNDGCHH